MHYKPTDSHSYILHSSSHPAHVKNSIPYSQFLKLRLLCNVDTDFSEKPEEMCQFLKTRGYPDPVIHNSKHRAQSIHPQQTPQLSHNKQEERIPLTHGSPTQHFCQKHHPKKFQVTSARPSLRSSQPLLISYKRDKNLSNFLVKSTLKCDHQPGTFKCACVRFRTCPFFSNVNKISGPKRTVAITDHFSCISTNLIYCITCTLCKKYTSSKRAADWVIISANTLGMLRLTIKTLLNQSRDISTSRTILKTHGGLWPFPPSR